MTAAAKRLALFGATGRMGRCVLRALGEGREFVLSGATASAHSARLGEDAAGGASGVRLLDDPAAALATAHVAIDFSRAAAVAGNLAACVARRVPLLIAVTGLDQATEAQIARAARDIAVLRAANTSLGVSVMTRLAALAAQRLGKDFDIEISEAHHRMKRDAPSGTAIHLGRAVSAARGADLADVAVYARHGEVGARPAGAVGFSVVRGGDIVGTHTVLFVADDESLEITHRATDRMCFARGALEAAGWLSGRAAGLYAMEEVLG